MKSLQKIPKNEKVLIKNKIRIINRAYWNNFSLKRYYILKTFFVINQIIKFFFLLIVPFLIHMFIVLSTQAVLKDKDISFVYILSPIMIGLAATFGIGIFVAILIGLGSSNEYFNCTEVKMFFNIRFWFILDNSYIGFNSIYYLLISLVAIIIKDWVDVVALSFISILLSVFLLIRYRIYSHKNKYEKFEYYLKHSFHYRKLKAFDVIKDNSLMSNDLALKKKSLEDSIFIDIAIKRTDHFIHFINEMSLMMKRNENVIKEQNIIEDYIKTKANQVRTPIDAFCLYFIVLMYLNRISSCKDSNLIKNITLTRESIFECLQSIINSYRKQTNYLNLKIDDLPSSVAFYLDFYKIYMYKFSKFEYSRIFYITVLSFYLDAINSFINKTKINADEIINLLNDEISKAKQLFDNHFKDSEDFVLRLVNELKFRLDTTN